MASDVTVEPVVETDAEFTQRFATLAARWRKETGHMSKMGRAADHPAYREIVAMGERAVPLLLAELEENGGHWFIALHEITGASPVPEEDAGAVRKMAAAWIAWGREQGYRWAEIDCIVEKNAILYPGPDVGVDIIREMRDERHFQGDE